MAKFELKLPKMGESVAEATITSWLKEVGDTIEADEAVLEIATDKVDSEVPSEVDGVLVEKLFDVDDVVQVGQTIAVIEIEGEARGSVEAPKAQETVQESIPQPIAVAEVEQAVAVAKEAATPVLSTGDRFYSPLVRNIAKQEGISQSELDAIAGTGKDGRVTKNDILGYIDNRANQPEPAKVKVDTQDTPNVVPVQNNGTAKKAAPVVASGEDEVIEMTRMGKLIAHHMVESVQTSGTCAKFH